MKHYMQALAICTLVCNEKPARGGSNFPVTGAVFML